ncbi:MAG: hypothetical protein ABIK09_19465 [Pseudomonadota bacterium]
MMDVRRPPRGRSLFGPVLCVLLLAAGAAAAVRAQEVIPMTQPSQVQPDAQDAVTLLDVMEAVETRYRALAPTRGPTRAAADARDWAASQPPVAEARLDAGGAILHLVLRCGLTGSVEFEHDPLKD